MSLMQSPVLLTTSKFTDALFTPHFRLRSTVIAKRRGGWGKVSDISGQRRWDSRVLCSRSQSDQRDIGSSSKENKLKSLFQSWDVPWDWKVTMYVMMPYLMSILFTGFVRSSLGTDFQPFSENMQGSFDDVDEVAFHFFMDQLLKTIAKLSILFILVSPYRPFPDDIFSYEWSQPLNRRYGWIIWGGGGLTVASSVVFLIEALLGAVSGQMQNEGESLMRLLPLVGESQVSTVCVLGVLSFLTPLCEETLYRGFLMVSLTKWFPMPVSLVISSAVFTLSHQSHSNFLEIFSFGIILGLVYAQTRNLAAPIAIHACWNLGVITTVIYLQSQGYDIHKYAL
ncbi:hypothetical protein H6P81_003049 [Aristolochia fimbriata]|uniref:CAAX prenyl protease 2/Lysostaphin resistance protein A-like domain-containing protein n=1 Tax=Aristolochia fimbriata TaxID=158543 RepID=A0AAV7FCL0_ARIFI|nr:hypothetical protein H6P81_003049 [Aristolochia fimbriata]